MSRRPEHGDSRRRWSSPRRVKRVTVTDATPSIDPRKTVTGATFGVEGAPAGPERPQRLGNALGISGGRQQSGQRGRQHGSPGLAGLEGNHRRHLQPRWFRHHARRPVADLLQLRLVPGDPGHHGRFGRDALERRHDVQHGDQARDQRHPRLGPLLLCAGSAGRPTTRRPMSMSTALRPTAQTFCGTMASRRAARC